MERQAIDAKQRFHTFHTLHTFFFARNAGAHTTPRHLVSGREGFKFRMKGMEGMEDQALARVSAFPTWFPTSRGLEPQVRLNGGAMDNPRKFFTREEIAVINRRAQQLSTACFEKCQAELMALALRKRRTGVVTIEEQHLADVWADITVKLTG